ncbi:anti-sigma factor family protein [Bradyrhizobium sp. USDA 4486]
MTFANDDETQLVHAYLDGELDVATALMTERKIAADPALRKLATEVSALKIALAKTFPRESVPAQLRTRIRAAVGLERIWRPQRWMLMAASLMIAVAMSSALTAIGLRELTPSNTGAELIDGHLRSLMAAQPTDVGSSDRHKVKPWFNGRITQSPRVVDLGSQGFELLGGRVDVVSKVPVPTLVYRKREHMISLTEIAEQGRMGVSFERRTENGFNVIQWRDRDRSYVAISDLNSAELEAFVKSFRDAAG